jgi:hypothetical protein
MPYVMSAGCGDDELQCELDALSSTYPDLLAIALPPGNDRDGILLTASLHPGAASGGLIQGDNVGHEVSFVAARLHLRVPCGAGGHYPDALPAATLEDARGLTDKRQQQLLALLAAEAEGWRVRICCIQVASGLVTDNGAR